MDKPSRAQKLRRGRIKPAGSTREERDRIALGLLESYMDGIIQGHLLCPKCGEDNPVKELPAGAVQLLRARYDKLRPSLQATELTTVDPRDKKAPADLESELVSILSSKPELLDRLLELRAKATNSTQSQANPPQSSVVTH